MTRKRKEDEAHNTRIRDATKKLETEWNLSVDEVLKSLRILHMKGEERETFEKYLKFLREYAKIIRSQT